MSFSIGDWVLLRCNNEVFVGYLLDIRDEWIIHVTLWDFEPFLPPMVWRVSKLHRLTSFNNPFIRLDESMFDSLINLYASLNRFEDAEIYAIAKSAYMKHKSHFNPPEALI